MDHHISLFSSDLYQNQSIDLRKVLQSPDSVIFDSDVYQRAFEIYKISIEVLVFVIGVVSSFANLVIVFVMLKQEDLRRNSANHYIIAITAADLVIAYVYPILIHENGKSFYAQIASIFFVVLMNLQVTLSADRYWAVCHHLTYFKFKDCGYKKWLICFCMLIGAVAGSTYGIRDKFCKKRLARCHPEDPCYPFVYRELEPNFYCIETKFCFMISIWIILSASIILISNGLIIISMWTHRRNQCALFAGNLTDSQMQRYKQERQITITMMIITLSFILCWLPFATYALAECIGGYSIINNFLLEKYGDNMGNFIYLTSGSSSFVLPVLNSILDPMIFMFRLKEVRIATRNMFRCDNLSEVNSRQNSV